MPPSHGLLLLKVAMPRLDATWTFSRKRKASSFSQPCFSVTFPCLSPCKFVLTKPGCCFPRTTLVERSETMRESRQIASLTKIKTWIIANVPLSFLFKFTRKGNIVVQSWTSSLSAWESCLFIKVVLLMQSAIVCCLGSIVVAIFWLFLQDSNHCQACKCLTRYLYVFLIVFKPNPDCCLWYPDRVFFADLTKARQTPCQQVSVSSL